MADTEAPPTATAGFSNRLQGSDLAHAISGHRFPLLRPLRIVPEADSKVSLYYTEDHVRGLVSDLGQSSSSCCRTRAAKKLRLLAKHNPENRLRIAAAGAVPVLISTLVQLQSASDDADGDQSPEVSCTELQEHAVTALYNLSLHDLNLPLIVASGAVSLAIGTLGSPGATSAAMSGAACLLLRLAHHDEAGKMLEDIGSSCAIPLLVDLLCTGELRAQKDAATLLFELTSRWAPNRTRAARAGLVQVLLELMENPGSGMVEKAGYLLSAIVEADEARADVAEGGGVAVLVDMIDMGIREQREIAVKVLFHMCSGSTGGREECLRAVAAEGAAPALLAVAQPESGCSAMTRRKAKALLEMLRHTSSAGAAGSGAEE